MSESSLKSRLLLATPALRSPVFDRAVVLLLEHADEGAVGLVLNRPTEAEMDAAVPDWAPFAAEPRVVFSGGPVEPGAVICLARTASEREGEAWTPLLGTVGMLNIGRRPDEVDQLVGDIRVFAGYAGWGPGQLEEEIAAGAWFVVEAEADDALTAQPQRLWGHVLRRQTGRLAAFATFPPDPSLN